MRINKDDYIEYNGFTFIEAKVNKIAHSIERYPAASKITQCRNCMLEILLFFIVETLEPSFVKEAFDSAWRELQKNKRDLSLFDKIANDLDAWICADNGWNRVDNIHLLWACAVWDFIYSQRRFKQPEDLSNAFVDFMERICRLIDKSEEDQLLTIIKKYFP